MAIINKSLPLKQSRFLAQLPIWLVYFFAISLIFKMRLVNNLVTGGVLLYIVLQIKGLRIKNNFLLWSSAGFFLLYLLGCFYSENLHQAGRNLERLLPLVILPLFFSVMPNLKAVNIKTTLILFVLSCLVVSCLCLADTYVSNQKKGIELAFHNAWYFSAENLIAGWGIHQSYFSLFVGLCINIVLYLWDKYKRFYFLGGLLMLYFFFFQLLLAARLPLVLSVLTFSLYLGRILTRKISLGGAVTIIGGLSLLIFFSILQMPIIREKFKGALSIQIDQDNKKFSADLRFYKWKSTSELIRENWLVGVGTGDLRDELEKIYKRDGCDHCFSNRYNPHNQFLDSWATIGLAGLLMLIWNLVLPVVSAIKRRDLLYLNFLFLFIGLSITESSLLMNKGVVFFSFFNAFFFYSFREELRVAGEVYDQSG